MLGRTVLVNGAPFEIIGVTAAGFRGLEVGGPDLWAPLSQLGQFRPADRGREDAGGVEIVGRLNAEIRLDALNVFDNVNFAPVSGLTTSTASTNVNFNRMNGSAPASFEVIDLTGSNTARVLQIVSRIRW